MSVYVDPLFEMAEQIGMKRTWFQNKPKLPDVVPSRRAKAVRLGAIEHSRS